MKVFERATNFVVQGCYFIDQSTGRQEALGGVLEKLKGFSATGVSYDSIDFTSRPTATLNADLLSNITSTSTNHENNNTVYFIHGTSPSDVRECGEGVAKTCQDKNVIFAGIFLKRLLSTFPVEAKSRLVPTLAYQLAVSPNAPEELKIEILGALHLEPDLPDKNVPQQLDKLIVRPLLRVKHLLNRPVVLLLDSAQNMNCSSIKNFIVDFMDAVRRLGQEVNARVVITSVGYRRVVNAVKNIPGSEDATRTYKMGISNPKSWPSRVRSLAFPILDLKFRMPELLQRAVEVIAFTSASMSSILAISLGCLKLLPQPLNLAGICTLVLLAPVASIGMSAWMNEKMAQETQRCNAWASRFYRLQ